MASVNKVIILGNICKDPEVRFMPSGDAMVNLSVATNEQWKDKTTGEKQERAEFHRIAIFGKLAEIAAEYLKKGSSAYFEGKLQTRKWTTKEGNDQYTTEIIADKMQMLGGKKDADAGDSKPSCGASQSSSWQSHGDDLDSDIPFNREEA